MSSTLLLLLGACGLIGIVAGAYYAVLLFHNPYKPKWLENRFADDVITVLLISSGTIVFGLVLKGVVMNGIDPLVALTIEFAFIVGVAMALWQKLHMRERLYAARNGLSPFSELRHIRNFLRHRFDDHGKDSGAMGAA